MYEKQEIYSISDMLYQHNQETFDSYDYVLIDYPPTINELSSIWINPYYWRQKQAYEELIAEIV